MSRVVTFDGYKLLITIVNEKAIENLFWLKQKRS